MIFQYTNLQFTNFTKNCQKIYILTTKKYREKLEPNHPFLKKMELIFLYTYYVFEQSTGINR